jgi:hypothetical protein
MSELLQNLESGLRRDFTLGWPRQLGATPRCPMQVPDVGWVIVGPASMVQVHAQVLALRANKIKCTVACLVWLLPNRAQIAS